MFSWIGKHVGSNVTKRVKVDLSVRQRALPWIVRSSDPNTVQCLGRVVFLGSADLSAPAAEVCIRVDDHAIPHDYAQSVSPIPPLSMVEAVANGDDPLMLRHAEGTDGTAADFELLEVGSAVRRVTRFPQFPKAGLPSTTSALAAAMKQHGAPFTETFWDQPLTGGDTPRPVDFVGATAGKAPIPGELTYLVDQGRVAPVLVRAIEPTSNRPAQDFIRQIQLDEATNPRRFPAGVREVAVTFAQHWGSKMAASDNVAQRAPAGGKDGQTPRSFTEADIPDESKVEADTKSSFENLGFDKHLGQSYETYRDKMADQGMSPAAIMKAVAKNPSLQMSMIKALPKLNAMKEAASKGDNEAMMRLSKDPELESFMKGVRDALTK